jgi:Flp pilus assembly protein TadD
VRVLLPIFTPAHYLWLLVWPSGLTPFTPPPGTVPVFLGAGMTVVLTSLLVRLRFRALLGGWLAYLILLAPTVGGTLLETGMQPWADRFAYLPLIPVFLALGAGVSRISPRPARVGALSVAALLLALTSRDQLRHWGDTEAIWTRVVHASPTLAKGYKNLGSIRSAQGRHDEAIVLFRKAVALKPSYAEAHNDLGLALAATGRFEEAVGSHRRAIALDSTRAEGYNGCGIALLRMGDVRGAREVLDRGVAAHPESARLRFNAGTAALAAGDTAGAIARFQETAGIDSTVAAAAESAAVLMELTGAPDARLWYERAAAAGSVPARERLARREAGHREDHR